MKYICLLLLVTAAACKNSSSEDNKTQESISITPSAVTTLATDTVKPQSVQQPQPATAATTIQPAVPVVNTATGINPEHGKPGHRCDIAVGALLNSKPTQPVANTTSQPVVNQAPTIVSTPQPIATKQSPAVINPGNSKSAVASGMNPEHGKPGHRCDIAVGSPLNSKPTAVQPVQTTQTAATPVSPSIQQPTPILPAKSSVPMAAGLNPEHGKPGHRCDISVGTPLNSKPANK